MAPMHAPHATSAPQEDGSTTGSEAAGRVQARTLGGRQKEGKRQPAQTLMHVSYRTWAPQEDSRNASSAAAWRVHSLLHQGQATPKLDHMGGLPTPGCMSHTHMGHTPPLTSATRAL